MFTYIHSFSVSTLGGGASSFPPNSGDGSLTITGLPARYDSGATYSLSVNLADPGQQRWGFELAVKDSNNQQAGTITVTDVVNTQSSTSGGITYLKQTSTGTYAGTVDGPVTWSFDWIAPSSGTGKVYFYVAGVAANDGSGTNGDYVYNISQEIPEKSTDVGDCCVPQGSLISHKFYLRQNYPNPFNPTTTIRYSLPSASHVEISVYNILGQKVKTLADGLFSKGIKEVVWDGKNQNGAEVATGVYFYIIKTEKYTEIKKMVLLR